MTTEQYMIEVTKLVITMDGEVSDMGDESLEIAAKSILFDSSDKTLVNLMTAMKLAGITPLQTAKALHINNSLTPDEALSDGI